MEKQKLIEALEKSELVSDPEMITELLEQSEGFLKAAYPTAKLTPQTVIGMAQLVLFFEDGIDDESEPEPELENE